MRGKSINRGLTEDQTVTLPQGINMFNSLPKVHQKNNSNVKLTFKDCGKSLENWREKISAKKGVQQSLYSGLNVPEKFLKEAKDIMPT